MKVTVCEAEWAYIGGFVRLKMEAVCGNCQRYFKTKVVDYAHNMDNRIIGHWPHCNRWNITKYIYT